MQAQTITFGYSDSEDRLWARLVINPTHEVKFWVTRRLLQNLIQSVANLLEQQTQQVNTQLNLDQVHQHLKKECFEASRATWDPTPPPPISPTQDTATIPSIEMCLEINIQIDEAWHFRFSGAKQKHICLSLERLLVTKFLIALIYQGKMADWEISSPAIWLA